MENINKIQIVPDEVYEVGADKAPVIPEWSVKDDTTLLQKVKALAHFTFDLSKFVVTGSPTITNNGIASGFSQYDFLAVGTGINYDIANHTYTFKGRIVYNNPSNGSSYCFDLFGMKYLIILDHATGSGTITLQMTNASDSFVTAFTTDSFSLSLNDYIDFELNLSSTKQEIFYSVNGGTVSSKDSTISPQLTTVSNAPFYIGAIGSASWYISTQATDLKYVALEENGVEVFSGNKTGIDTIKADDYTAPVSRTLPDITDNGIASGFTDSKMIQLSNSAIGSSYTTFDIYWKQKFTSFSGAPFSLLTTSTGYNPTIGGSGLIIYTWGTGKPVIRLSSDGTNNDIANDVESDVAMVVNTDYYFRFSFDGSSYKLYGSTDGENYSVWKTITSSTKMYGLYDFILGGIWPPTYGVYDLNAFKIYVDDNLVYQPCLKIPYTEGQNYVKVVDKLYRDRVKDLFEQKGYNGYYTIGEDDFTLPSNKWSDVIEHKENGLTVAEQRVDQTLTIRGACEQGVDVNLPMEFFSADSYAVFGVGTTGTNTASKFTPAADGNYIAIGKGKV